MAAKKRTRATVRRSLLVGKKIPDALSAAANTCSAGAQCTEVQNDPVAKQALGALQTATTTAQGSLTRRQALAQALLAAIQTLGNDFDVVRTTLGTYEMAVNSLANGDAAIINAAGLLSRLQKPPPAALGKVSVVHSKLGKHLGEAIVSWPAGPGATSYAIEVNFTATPQNPAGTWTALASGTGRRRVVKAPTPGAEFQVRVASIGSDGTQSEWSDTATATAL
jgi:hypothetical protein